MATQSATDLLEIVDLFRLDVARRLDPDRRAELGQFFTPASIAAFMAGLSEVKGDALRILDPGAGIGTLSAALVSKICQRKKCPASLSITAYESDGELIPYLKQTLETCGNVCDNAGIDYTCNVIEASFIEAGVELLEERPLFDTAEPFHCVILNPPYRKLNRQSDTRRSLTKVGIETSNLYAAFLWLSFRLLEKNGELIAITPRSFCNGPYFRPFRMAFLEAMTIRRMHVFESRNSAFKDAKVLQENVIFRAVKNRRPAPALVSVSAGPSDPDIQIREIPHGQLVDSDSVIHIVTDEIGGKFAERVRSLPCNLEDLDIQVSTGRVVDFRSRDALQFNANGRTVPLVYPVHFEHGYVSWPKGGKKPDYLRLNSDTKGLVVPKGVYVLVKRFSAKEEKRRVTAAVCDPARMPDSAYGFENHLNYFHRNGEGLPVEVAKGLSAYLNSSLLDAYFRHFSGHTQVNASDLRSLRYPDINTLERIGAKIGESYPSQEATDDLVNGELNMAGDDPAKVKKRIDESLAVIKSLGLPKAQHNERSALTLLSLLDLKPTDKWDKASAPLMGIRPMMDWFAEHYGKRYAENENTRESVRRYTVHQFLEAGIIVQNPDDPERPTNSGKNVYQIESDALELLQTHGTKEWDKNLKTWLSSVETLKTRYAKEREMTQIPLTLETGEKISLSPGGQNILEGIWEAR